MTENDTLTDSVTNSSSGLATQVQVTQVPANSDPDDSSVVDQISREGESYDFFYL